MQPGGGIAGQVSSGSVKIRATEKEAARPADQFAAAVFEARAAGRAKAAVVLGSEHALLFELLFCCCRWSEDGLHGKRLAQILSFQLSLLLRPHRMRYG